MNKKAIALVVCLIAFVGVTVLRVSLTDDEIQPIRLGYLQSDLHHLPLFTALEKGFFEEAGLAVEVAGVFKAGPEEMSAFSAGELDIGYVGQAPATAAVLNNIADVTFASQVNLNGSAIVVAFNAPFKTLPDLRNRLIAIPGHATMQDLLLRRALANSGMDMQSVKIIVLKPPEMIQALEQGNIDAFIAWEPYPAQAVAGKSGRILLQSKDIWPSHPCCVLVADSVFVDEKPDVLRALRTVHRQSCAFIAENPGEAVRIGVQYTGLDAQAVATALKTIEYTDVIDRSKVSEFIEFLRTFNYIKSKNGATFKDIRIFEK